MRDRYISPIAFSLNFWIVFLLMLCIPTSANADKATLIYHMAGQVTSLVKKIGGVKEDSNTGLPIFTLEDGSQVKIAKGNIVESLRPENPDKGDAIISLLFPTEGIGILAGTFIEAGMNLFQLTFQDACDYDLPKDFLGYEIDCHLSEKRYLWPSEERTWEKTVLSSEGRDYSFKFGFSIGVPNSDYAKEPNSWLMYVRNLNTQSSDFLISYFYLRLNLFGSVYIDIPKLGTGNKLLVKIPKDVFKKSGYNSNNINSLLESMKIEANGYQSTWFGSDEDLATASELGPVVKVLPPSRTVAPGSTFDIDFIVSDTSLTGIEDLDTNTLKVYYNGNDITHVFIEGIVGGQFPYSYYVDTTDKSEKDRRYIVTIQNVVFKSGTHEVELNISDKQGHSASEKVVYTVQTLLATPTGFSASASSSTVNLSWGAVSGASGYKLHYGTSSGTYIGSADLGSGTSYVINNVPDGTYYLAITAYNSAGESCYSNEVSITISQADGDVGDMVRVPAGEFIMGGNEGDGNERPVHTVYLDEFYIDKYEVTNAQFVEFLNAQGNLSPEGYEYLDIYDPDRLINLSGGVYIPDSGYENHPVVEISWYGARDYCKWAGKRLPTEAEWEKAARGTDARKYPWGNDSPDCNKVNFSGCVRDTAPVGSYPAGVSPYGAYDMAGNAFEWVADWFGDDYYSVSPYSNPQGPSRGRYRVLRGGTWLFNADFLRAATRVKLWPDDSDDTDGCRCVQDK